jgi:transketolase
MTQIIHPINRAKLATERPRMVKYQTAMGKGQRADEAVAPVLISSS